MGTTLTYMRAAIKGRNPEHLSWLSMLHFPLIVWVKLPVVDRIYSQSNKFTMGVENKATGHSNVNDSAVYGCSD